MSVEQTYFLVDLKDSTHKHAHTHTKQAEMSFYSATVFVQFLFELCFVCNRKTFIIYYTCTYVRMYAVCLVPSIHGAKLCFLFAS